MNHGVRWGCTSATSICVVSMLGVLAGVAAQPSGSPTSQGDQAETSGLGDQEVIIIGIVAAVVGVLAMVLLVYCLHDSCSHSRLPSSMHKQLASPVDIDKPRRKFTYHGSTKELQMIKKEGDGAEAGLEDGIRPDVDPEIQPRRSSVSSAFVSFGKNDSARYGGTEVHRANPVFDSSTMSAIFDDNTSADFTDDESIDNELDLDLTSQGFGFGALDSEKPDSRPAAFTPTPMHEETFDGFGFDDSDTNDTDTAYKDVAPTATTIFFGDESPPKKLSHHRSSHVSLFEPAALGIETAVLEMVLASANAPKHKAPASMTELMYTPTYINKWFMIEFRKSQPNSDSAGELELALKQAAELFTEADVDQTGELNLQQVEDVLVNIGSYLMGEDLKELFVKVDDDSNGLLRYREFANLRAIEEGHIAVPFIDNDEPMLSIENVLSIAPECPYGGARDFKKLLKKTPGVIRKLERGKVRLVCRMTAEGANHILDVDVVEAVHLQGKSSIVECRVDGPTKKVVSQRSKTVKSNHPVFASSFQFTVESAGLASSRLVVSIVDAAKPKLVLGTVAFPLLDVESDSIDTEGWFNLTHAKIAEHSFFRNNVPIPGVKASIGKGSERVSRSSTRHERKIQKVIPPTSLETLKPLRLLGKGSFGRVVSAIDTHNNIFAVKCVEKSRTLDNETYISILTERRVLSGRDGCLMIPHLFSSFQTASHLYFALEVFHGGDLETHMSSQKDFSVSATRFYVAEMLVGLWHLHDHGVIYRDLKPENILLDSKGHVKLTDFGLSKDGMESTHTTSTFCGTPEYLAPEILRSSPYSKSVDFWALGVVAYRLLVGKYPFKAQTESLENEELFEIILGGNVVFPASAKIPKAATSFVQGLLQPEVSSRLGCHVHRGHLDIQAHAFLSSVDWNRAATQGLKTPSRPRLQHRGDDVSSEGTHAFQQLAHESEDEIDQSVFAGFDWTQNTTLF
eukprot:m.262012 g.262012  ORF g.262012 m.262012 type:complete len:967 (-) comp44104_c0_seq1:306-3206(-)